VFGLVRNRGRLFTFDVRRVLMCGISRLICEQNWLDYWITPIDVGNENAMRWCHIIRH
jgi:hypothetical protein